MLIISACDLITNVSSPTRPPASVQTPPLYPGAQSLEASSNAPEDKVIVFQTVDNAVDVLAFYDKVLRDDGWYRCESNSDEGLSCLPVRNGIVLQWVQGSIDGPTNLGYRFTVVATDTGKATGLTDVRIEIIRFNPTSIYRYGTPTHQVTNP
ncbi:MAG: hypothetical protein IVW55_03630 [Chloroflexi bacterium]|nr:hypothetical protein [Chloroflexota bacterium]